MTNEELRARLTALHEELDGIDAVELEIRGLLQQLATDIRPIIEPSTQTGDFAYPATIKERLAQTITAVEGSHPRLARTLSDLVDTMVFYNL